MLPLSHTYVSNKVTGRQEPLLVFGSVLPDIAHISAGKIDRIKIHDSPQEFYDFVSSNFPKLLDLAVGVKLHSPVGRGADYYSDDEKEGFAKIEGKKISTEAGKLWKVEDPHESLVLAHNFIEASVDLNLLESNPEILSIYESGVKDTDLDEIALCLSQYLELESTTVRGELENFVNLLSPSHLSSAESLVREIIIPWRKMIYGIQADFQQTLNVLTLAKNITRQDYLDFLNGAVEKMKVDFADLISNKP